MTGVVGWVTAQASFLQCPVLLVGAVASQQLAMMLWEYCICMAPLAGDSRSVEQVCWSA